MANTAYQLTKFEPVQEVKADHVGKIVRVKCPLCWKAQAAFPGKTARCSCGMLFRPVQP